MRTHGLSKSRIMAGIQCPKRLYLQTHQSGLADESGSEYAFAMGNAVGEVAQTLHSGGVLVEHVGDLTRALKETEKYISNDKYQTLFEGAFKHDGVLIRADVLTKTPDGLHLVEVKSSTSAKDHYLYDCAIQAWVMKSAGYDLARVELAHVDNSFVLEEEGNYEGLLNYVDLTEQALSLQDQVAAWVDEFKSVLAGSIPEVEMGPQCSDPYACPFMGYCAGEQPEFPVGLLPRGKKVAAQLQAEGIEDIRDIPEGRLENERHEQVRRVTVSGQVYLDQKFKEFLKAMAFPRYYLDFETINPAVPMWLKTNPYQQLPFQWSCHIEKQTGTMEHREFLDISGDSPMHRFCETLIDSIGREGPVIVYGHFEKSRLTDMARLYPDLADSIQNIIDRLIDLLPLIRKYYYHRDMKGSSSLKAVLPTVVPELSYENLGEVQHGQAAQLSYLECIDNQTDDIRRKCLYKDMLAYCERDTEAMLKLVHVFTDR